MKSIEPISFLLAALTLASSGSLRSTPASEPERSFDPVNQWVTLCSENLEPIAGGRVMFKTTTSTLVRSTSDGGSTSPVTAVPGEAFDLFFKAVSQPFGEALGQVVRGWDVPTPSLTYPPGAYRYSEAIFSQPVLRPSVLSSEGHLVSHGEDSLWAFYPNTELTSAFSISAFVGSLSTGESVLRYLDYCGVEPLAQDYRYGLGIQTPDVEDFGEYGGVFDLYCTDMGFQSEPLLDVCFLGGDSSKLGSTTLETAQFWDNGHLRVVVSGSIGHGTTLLLLRPNDGGASNALYESVVQPPVFPPRARDLPSLSASTCTPTPPSCQERPCEPPVPPKRVDAGGNCDLEPTPNGSGVTVGVAIPVGAILCGSGGSVNVGGTTQWGVSVSAQFELHGIDVEGGGHYDDESTVVQEVPLDSGLGCGQCALMYSLRCVVRQYWIVESPINAPGRTLGGGLIHVGCEDLEVQTACVLNYKVARKCDIPPPCD